MAKFCGQCGSPLDPGTGLCPRCAGSGRKNHPGKQIRRILIGLIAVAVAAGAGAAAFLRAGTEKTSPQEQRVSDPPAPAVSAPPEAETLAPPEPVRYLTSLTTYTGDGRVWYSLVFDWDQNGKLLQVQETEDPDDLKTWTFQYDENGQLLREDLTAGDYSYTCEENTYGPDGKLQSGKVATEDGIREDTYHYDGSGRLYKVIRTDDFSRQETTFTSFNDQGRPTQCQTVITTLSTGAQSHAIELYKYDKLGRKTEWSYSGSDGEYRMTYRHDVKSFLVCEDARGTYVLTLQDADGMSCWEIDVGTGELEIDPEGFLTRISCEDGCFFEFQYSSPASRNG